MSKVLIAVCDADAAYGRKLGEWITLGKGGDLAGCSFSSPGQFLEFQKTKAPDVALLGQGFWEDAQIAGQAAGAMAEEAKKGHGETLWLCLYGSGGADKIPESLQMLPVVEKYQPASGIVREIFSYCQQYREGEQEPAGPGPELVGIYSPGQDPWQTPFALTFAQELGREERVLYVNFKECAGFSSWLKESYQRDLMDVMYLCLTGDEENVPDCIRSAVYVLEGVDYIPPSEDSLCLGQVSGQDYVRFVRLLAEKSGYGSIILDFGMMVPGFLELLGLCSKIYVLGGQMGLKKHALEHFRQMMGRQEGNQKLEEKLCYLTLPKIAVNCQGDQMQQWVWGELGDYVRGLLGVQIGTD